MGKEARDVLFLIAAWWMVFIPGPTAAADAGLILGVHPYLPVSEIKRRFSPLADYLAQVAGQSVTVRVGGNYEEHIEAVGNDRIDIAFLGPVPFLHVTQRFGHKPLLAAFAVNGKPQLYGVIFTRQDSAVQSLAELADKRFAFGDPESTMSHIVPRYLLMQAGIAKGLPRRAEFLGAHKNVALAVLAGDFDAGAVKKEVFDEFAPRGLRALVVSPGVPDHLFVTRSNMSPLEVARLRDAMLRLKDQPQGAQILASLHQGLTALIPVSQADYAPLREIVAAVEAAND